MDKVIDIGGVKISVAKLRAYPAEQLKMLYSIGVQGLKSWEPSSKTKAVQKALNVIRDELKRRADAKIK